MYNTATMFRLAIRYHIPLPALRLRSFGRYGYAAGRDAL